ncbi:MAG: LysR family transcriptional regulator [Gammaproteobacteria bacterium]
MNWNDLKSFLAIAEAGSLNGAARTLRQNHSTVFRRLNALESDLGVRLFERLPQGYVLTSPGERLVELAREADNAVQKIQRELAGRDLAPTGKVRLTTAPNIAQAVLPEVVAKLRRECPGIVLEIAVGDSDYDLNRREADIAVRATTTPPENLVGRKILDLDWWVYRGSGLRSKIPKSMDELGNYPLIGADAAMIRLKVFQWLEARHAASIVARSNDLSTMAAMAAAGVGMALLPSDQREHGVRRTLKVPDSHGELWLLTHPDLRNITRIRVVWDALVSHGFDYIE